MPKIEDNKLIDVVNRGNGMTIREVTDESGYAPGSEGIVMLRLKALAERGKIRVDYRQHANRKTQAFWYPIADVKEK